MSTSNVRNMPASQAYGARAEELKTLVKGLEAEVNASLVDAHEAHWGHIGDMGRALQLAQQLREVLRGNIK